MKLQCSGTNAMCKWLKADFPRLPTEPGKQPGVNSIISSAEQMCWQLHIIENEYRSWHKTIIATEATSRFTVFLPVDLLMSTEKLTQRLQMQWQLVLAESVQELRLLPGSDIALLLSNLNEADLFGNCETHWVKNTDRSVNGHITDAGLWVTQTLANQKQQQLSAELAMDLAIYLNTQPKRAHKDRSRFIPAEALLRYCQSLIAKSAEAEPVKAQSTRMASAQSGKGNNSQSNVVYLKDFKQ
jgi:hypothetical protein